MYIYEQGPAGRGGGAGGARRGGGGGGGGGGVYYRSWNVDHVVDAPLQMIINNIIDHIINYHKKIIVMGTDIETKTIS
jgi:hypothetical protein